MRKVEGQGPRVKGQNQKYVVFRLLALDSRPLTLDQTAWLRVALQSTACRIEPSNACWVKRASNGSAAGGSACLSSILPTLSFTWYGRRTDHLVADRIKAQSEELSHAGWQKLHIEGMAQIEKPSGPDNRDKRSRDRL